MTEELEIFYKHTPQGDLRMRVYHPQSGSGKPRPVMVFFYGGGWRSGRLNQFEPQARHFAAKGWLVFLPEYRIADVHNSSPLEAVWDAKSAIRWVLGNLDGWGGDPGLLVTGGGSAGGHLALTTVLAPDINEPGEDVSLATTPRALALFNPVVDTTETGFTRHSLNAEEASSISPIHLLKNPLPPALLLHGTADSITPFSDALRFLKAYQEQGGECELLEFEGLDHGFFNYGKHENIPYQQTLERLELFLQKHGLWTDSSH